MKINRDIASDMIREAINGGADLAEVYMVSGSSLTVDVKSQEIDALEKSEDFGYSLRVVRGHCPGFSYSTVTDDWRLVVEKALEASRFTEEDKFLDMAEQRSFPDIGIFDNAVAGISEEDAISSVMSIEASAFGSDSRIKKTRKASGTFSEKELLVMNSRGVEGSYRSTAISGQIMVVAEDDSSAEMGWGYESSRFLSGIDFSRIGREAAERALQLLGARKAVTGKGYILLDSPVATEFLGVLASAFSSENVQKGKSLLAGKKGHKVMTDRVSIIDSGLLNGRIGSRPFDAEGTPSRRSPLINEGRLLDYLYNIYTAGKDGTSSTGNAVRGGIDSAPSVGISNLYLEAASDEHLHELSGLIKAMNSGLIVTEAMGVHTANPVTGEFSFGVAGLWVEGGEIKYPVKEAAISGTMLEFFDMIVGVGSEIRFYGKVGSPCLLVEGIDISG